MVRASGVMHSPKKDNKFLVNSIPVSKGIWDLGIQALNPLNP